MNAGKVYWITGLSGAGKTTIGKQLYEEVKDQHATVILDGDRLRKLYEDDLAYSPDDRKKLAMRYSKLCEFLAAQGIDVICCTISMFDEVRDYNRENIENYIEIYLKVTRETLIKRDQKGLYSGFIKGKVHNLMGMDIDFEEPKNPNILIENDGEKTPEEIVQLIKNFHINK